MIAYALLTVGCAIWMVREGMPLIAEQISYMRQLRASIAIQEQLIDAYNQQADILGELVEIFGR